MKHPPIILILGVILISVIMTGCYTQVGSTRTETPDEEYTYEEEEADTPSEEVAYVDSSVGENDYYFDEYGYPRNRFYMGYYPSTILLGVGVGYYYDPWSWRYYDPWWCWNYAPVYAGWWSPGYGYGYGFGYYPPVHTPYYRYRDYAGGGRGSTRTVGSTRGSASSRGSEVGSRGSDAGRVDLPTGVRNGSGGSRAPETKDLKTSTGRREVKGTRAGSREGTSVRGGSSRTGGSRTGTTTRTAPRRPAKQPESTQPGNTGGSTRSGGGRSVTPAPAPQPANPPANTGGSRGGNSGSTRGGGKR